MLFEVPFHKYKVRDWYCWRSRILSELKGGKVLPNRTEGIDSTMDSLESDYHVNQGELPPYFELVAECLKPILLDFQDRSSFPVVINNMWYQTTQKGQMHGVHNHGGIGISAVFYVNFDSSCHRGTTFFAPFPNYLDGSVLEHTPDVVEGDVVFFPSFLHHQQGFNFSEKERTIIAFNIDGSRPKPSTSRGKITN